MTTPSLAQRMESTIREYIRACNAADAAAISAFFMPEATHYFPQHAKWAGAPAIGQSFAKIVTERGISWTVDHVATDTIRYEAVMEWTQFSRPRQQIVRGIDWFAFDGPQLRIREVRCYYATNWPVESRMELQDFDYAARGYPVAFPDS
jgi:hypothetical protein